MQNSYHEKSNHRDEMVGALLRAGLKNQAPTDEFFVKSVMRQIDVLDETPSFPPLLWAVPAVLVICLAVSIAWNLPSNSEIKSDDLEELLLIDLPAESQNLLTRSPSYSNALWNHAQGGLLP